MKDNIAGMEYLREGSRNINMYIYIFFFILNKPLIKMRIYKKVSASIAISP